MLDKAASQRQQRDSGRMGEVLDNHSSPTLSFLATFIQTPVAVAWGLRERSGISLPARSEKSGHPDRKHRAPGRPSWPRRSVPPVA